ncbi:MarR family winged helix-turn-helix transcriptional regulator [Subtercola sp. YIM 133946]|uniref:MarR family winged helix-turn-helix transcriptional regulator n=1 Tax=Subtercola sp. YIM 133946 TaxID=3118909 RepID=UPI002F92BFED
MAESTGESGVQPGVAADEKSWEDEFTYILWRAQQAVHKRAQDSLDALGVTVTQLGLAVHLQEQGRLSASDLSRAHHITPQSVGTALSHLEKIGWVGRAPHPVHRRVILFDLTEAGAAGVAEGRRMITEENREVTAAISKRDVDVVLKALVGIVVALEGESRPAEALWPESYGAARAR